MTSGQTCHKITQAGVMDVPQLTSSQEEADTRMLFHVDHIIRSGYKSVVISSDDTDVFILCLAYSRPLIDAVYLKSGTKTRIEFLDVGKAATGLGQNVTKALIGMHAYTGCDTVSAFAGRGKLRALKLLIDSRQFQNMFANLGEHWELSDELFEKLQSFTCTLYSAKSGTNNTNDLRYRLFCARKGEIDSHLLPPCADALKKHALRANYQACIWRRSLEGCPAVPSPVGHGWLRALKLLIDSRQFQNMFASLGEHWELSDELFEKLQSFTCTLYSAKSGTNNTNDLRYRLFCARKGEIDSHLLPPYMCRCIKEACIACQLSSMYLAQKS